MKLAFFRKPLHNIPSHHEPSLQNFRERILTILLVCALSLGALAFVTVILPVLRKQQYDSAIVYSVCYLWILIVTIQRRKFSYAVKAYSLMFVIYLLGLFQLIQKGPSADAGFFLLTFTIMATMMISARSGLVALFLSLGAFSSVGYLMSTGNLNPSIPTSYLELLDWISGGVVLILLGIILNFSLNTILRGLNDNITRTKILAVDADRDREQLRQRNQDLQRRLAQLRAAAEIEHTISAVLDPKELTQKVVNMLGERFGLYHVGVFLLRENELSTSRLRSEADNLGGDEIPYSSHPDTQCILQAGIEQIVPVGYRLTIPSSSNIGWVIQNRKPRAFDISSQKEAFTATYLPLARTELILPLLHREHIIGFLMIDSTQANAFDEEDIAMFQSTTDSLTTTLENARLFKQTQEDLEEIRALQRQYLNRTWTEVEEVFGNLSYNYQADDVKTVDTNQLEQTASTSETISTYNTPINLRDQPIGQFILEADQKGWTNEDRSFIESVITEAALALENARLLDETQRRADRDRFIADISRTVRTSTDIETILSTAIRELGRNLEASEAIIHLNEMDEDPNQKTPSDSSGEQEVAP
jgi:GAF domain-containing protein